MKYLFPVFLFLLFSSWSLSLQTTKVVEPELAFVQGGKFFMGSKKDDPDAGNEEKPQHEVLLSSFYMGKYEVTFDEFKTFVNETGYKTDADKDGGSNFWNSTKRKWEIKPGLNWKFNSQGHTLDIDEKRLPVIHISWNDTQAYIQWLNQKTGKTYRLPTEAEWEFAAKGGMNSHGYVYSGSNNIDIVAYYNTNSGKQPHSVGEKQSNELRIFDMTGNVWEWCEDWYDSTYFAGRPDLDVNPSGGIPDRYRVIRGGSWNNPPVDCRVTSRRRITPDYRSSRLGFRLVLPSK